MLIKESVKVMIGINSNHVQKNTNCCDHIFSYATQYGVHIFKCENCSLEQIITGDSMLAEHTDILKQSQL